MKSSRFAFSMALSFSFTAFAQAPPAGQPQAVAASPVQLQQLKRQKRVLMIFGDASTEAYKEQLTDLQSKARQLKVKEIVVYGITGNEIARPIAETETPELVETTFDLRRRFSLKNDQFTVVFLGKDGGVKIKETRAVPAQKIIDLINSIPLDQQKNF